MSKPKKQGGGRDEHEAKPEQAPGFKGGYSQGSRDQPKLRVGNRDREPQAREELWQPVNITGKYRHEDDRYHLFINHAGQHIEVLLAMVGLGPASSGDVPDKKRTAERVIRFGGDAAAIDHQVYALYFCKEGGPVDDKSLACGELIVQSSGAKRAVRLALDLSGVEAPNNQALTKKLNALAKLSGTWAKRYDASPNLFEQHLAYTWIPAQARTLHWFPLTPTQEKQLKHHIFDARVKVDPDNYRLSSAGEPFDYLDLVLHFFDPKGKTPPAGDLQKRQRQANVVTALNKLVKTAFSNAIQLPIEAGGIDEHQFEYWREATLYALATHEIERNPGFFRDLLVLTQDMLDGAMPEADKDGFAKLLSLEPSTGGHDYSADITLVAADKDVTKNEEKVEKFVKKFLKMSGKAAKKLAKRISRGVALTGMIGGLTVRKPEPGAFEAKYLVLLGGGKLGGSIGDSKTEIESSGTAKFYGLPYRPEHIAGVGMLVDFGVNGFGPGIGLGYSGTYLRCYGGGVGKPEAPLQFNFSGFSDIKGIEAGIGIALTRLWGKIIYVESVDGTVEDGLPEETGVVVRYRAGAAPLHFPINGASLTADGQSLIEIFAASELAVLSQRGIRLEVHGYADQPDKEFNNKILSRNRAISAYNYLMSILGDDLTTPELMEIPSEQVELANFKADPKYEMADPSPRKGGVMIVGHGEPEGQADAELYDQELRRVDLYLNGVVHVMLGRSKDH